MDEEHLNVMAPKGAITLAFFDLVRASSLISQFKRQKLIAMAKIQLRQRLGSPKR